MAIPNKSLGQHWLKDRLILEAIADKAAIEATDTVLEIGPGLGTLTSDLLRRAKKVVAVEFDHELARKLPDQFPGKNLEVLHEDILSFDLSTLPKEYIVVANIPYYITAKIIQKFTTAAHKPRRTVLLIQKEVAERVAAEPGDMSLLALHAQVYTKVQLGPLVPAEYFTPPPKVDSQVVILDTLPEPQIPNEHIQEFSRITKAGFSAKRKKLRSSLAGGLHMSKSDVEALLTRCDISPHARAQDLSIDDWYRIVLDALKR